MDGRMDGWTGGQADGWMSGYEVWHHNGGESPGERAELEYCAAAVRKMS